MKMRNNWFIKSIEHRMKSKHIVISFILISFLLICIATMDPNPNEESFLQSSALGSQARSQLNLHYGPVTTSSQRKTKEEQRGARGRVPVNNLEGNNEQYPFDSRRQRINVEETKENKRTFSFEDESQSRRPYGRNPISIRPLPKNYIPISKRFDLTIFKSHEFGEAISYEHLGDDLKFLFEKYIKRSKLRLASRGKLEEEIRQMETGDEILHRVSQPTTEEITAQNDLDRKRKIFEKQVAKQKILIKMYLERKHSYEKYLLGEEKKAKMLKEQYQKEKEELLKKKSRSENPHKYTYYIKQLEESCVKDLSILLHETHKELRQLEIIRKELFKLENEIRIEEILINRIGEDLKMKMKNRIQRGLLNYEIEEARNDKLFEKEANALKARKTLIDKIEYLEVYIVTRGTMKSKKEIIEQNILKKEYAMLLEKEKRNNIQCYYPVLYVPRFIYEPLRLSTSSEKQHMEELRKQFIGVRSPNAKELAPAIEFIESHQASGTNNLNLEECKMLRAYIVSLPNYRMDDQYTEFLVKLRKLFVEYCFLYGHSQYSLPYLMNLRDERLQKSLPEQTEFVLNNKLLYKVEDKQSVLMLLDRSDAKEAEFLQRFRQKNYERVIKNYETPYSPNELRCLKTADIISAKKRKDVFEGEGGVAKNGDVYIFSYGKWKKSTMEKVRSEANKHRWAMEMEKNARLSKYAENDVTNQKAGEKKKENIFPPIFVEKEQDKERELIPNSYTNSPESSRSGSQESLRLRSEQNFSEEENSQAISEDESEERNANKKRLSSVEKKMSKHEEENESTSNRPSSTSLIGRNLKRLSKKSSLDKKEEEESSEYQMPDFKPEPPEVFAEKKKKFREKSHFTEKLIELKNGLQNEEELDENKCKKLRFLIAHLEIHLSRNQDLKKDAQSMEIFTLQSRRFERFCSQHFK